MKVITEIRVLSVSMEWDIYKDYKKPDTEIMDNGILIIKDNDETVNVYASGSWLQVDIEREK